MSIYLKFSLKVLVPCSAKFLKKCCIPATEIGRNYASSTYTFIPLQAINLAPLSPSFIPSRGMKDRDVLTKRCKDCYFQRVDGRWYVFCKTHPRHKQRQKMNEKDKWIITHSTHGTLKY